ncbi:MAG TPA: phenylalanine--tRNA ligase subunit beta, partial [Thermodesulfobacteriaceae bacterium]|nr:phenylalanine--tRNA ligase subunit beta [Thermodesulfobacteriaceae bacterium]
GPAIEVRTARNGEKITTIDDVERTLQPEMLVIADAGKPVAVAGIMGGAASGVTDRTSRILLESAWFAPGQVRRTAKALKLPTESSYRFERGIDPEGVITALERAVNLVQDITGATLSGPVIDIYPRPFTPVSIKLRTARAGTVLGCNIKHHEILHILESIGLKITDSRHDSVIGLAPSFRPDLVEEIDLIEEVARLHGYSNIPVRAPVAEITTRPPDNAQILLKKLKTILTSLGMTETISYSFLSPRDIEALCFGDTDPRKRMVRIRNPLSDDQAVMRTSLVASLLKSIGRNHAQRNLDVRLFETGTVFIATEAGRLPVEEHRVAGAWTGSRHIESWAWPENKADLFDLKGVVEGMLSSIGISHWDIQLGTPEDPYFMPGASARILGKDGAVLAVFGQVAPEVEKSYEIKGPVFVFDASVQELLQASSSARRKFQPLARYPSVERDIAVIVEDRVPAKDLLAFIYDKAPDFLENVRIFDVYRGKPVPEGFKSVGLRFRYRAPDHTLSDSHVSEMHNPITESLLKSFNATLRS